MKYEKYFNKSLVYSGAGTVVGVTGSNMVSGMVEGKIPYAKYLGPVSMVVAGSVMIATGKNTLKSFGTGVGAGGGYLLARRIMEELNLGLENGNGNGETSNGNDSILKFPESDIRIA